MPQTVAVESTTARVVSEPRGERRSERVKFSLSPSLAERADRKIGMLELI